MELSLNSKWFNMFFGNLQNTCWTVAAFPRTTRSWGRSIVFSILWPHPSSSWPIGCQVLIPINFLFPPDVNSIFAGIVVNYVFFILTLIHGFHSDENYGACHATVQPKDWKLQMTKGFQKVQRCETMVLQREEGLVGLAMSCYSHSGNSPRGFSFFGFTPMLQSTTHGFRQEELLKCYDVPFVLKRGRTKHPSV